MSAFPPVPLDAPPTTREASGHWEPALGDRPPDRAANLVICDLTQFYSPVSGGVKRYLSEKKAYLHRAQPGCRHILVVPGAENTRVVDGPATVYEIASPLLNKTSRYRLLLDYARVREIVRAEHPDVIESGDPYQLAWQAVGLGRELDIPVVGFYHSHFPEAYLRTCEKYAGPLAARVFLRAARQYARHLYNNFSATMVASPALLQVLAGWGVRGLRQVDLGVDTQLYRPLAGDREALRTRLGLPTDRVVLLYVGRLAQEKNVRRLYEAWPLLQGRRPGGFHLVVVGDGVLRGELEQVRESVGGLTWIPYCEDSAELARIYQAADVLVHPGLQETFGLAALEAQACATPVVGIRGSYMDRIIFNDQGHWANADSAEALAAAILRLARNDLPELGRQASAAVLDRYSWDVVCQRILQIYQETIDRHHRGDA